MQIEELINIFNFENVKYEIISPYCIEESHNNGENFYRIELIESGWKLIFVQKEKMNSIKIIKEFLTKEAAIRFFCFYELQKIYSNFYIDKVIEEKDIIGTEEFNIKDILNVFDELCINRNYYGIYGVKNNAVNLIQSCDNMYIVVFVNEKGDKVHKTIELDKATALYAMFRWVYLEFLIRNHANEMKKIGLLMDGIKDEDYKVLFS